MKKLLLLSFTLLLVSTVMAQEFSLGPRVGISQTKIDLKNPLLTPGDAEVGYHFGLFARLSVASLYVQPELLYTQTSGSLIADLGPIGSENFDLEFNRMDLPVMVGLKLFRVLRVQAGPILSYDIGSKIKDSSGANLPGVDYEKFSVAYQAGLGVDIGNLYLDAKYEGSLGGVLESIGSLDTDERLSQFVFSVGFNLF